MVKGCMENIGINLIDNAELKKLLDKTIRIELYQFGSSLEKEDCNDIDLLLIYNNGEKNNQSEILVLKRSIEDYLSKQYRSVIDITVLSENEENEKNFLEQINYLKIY